MLENSFVICTRHVCNRYYCARCEGVSPARPASPWAIVEPLAMCWSCVWVLVLL